MDEMHQFSGHATTIIFNIKKNTDKHIVLPESKKSAGKIKRIIGLKKSNH